MKMVGTEAIDGRSKGRRPATRQGGMGVTGSEKNYCQYVRGGSP